jgi:hypothetical protein
MRGMQRIPPAPTMNKHITTIRTMPASGKVHQMAGHRIAHVLQ